VNWKRLIALVALLACAGPVRPDERAVVLIVGATSPVASLDSIEVRKLFLGLTVTRSDRALRPVDDFSDTRLKQIFFQHIVAMTQWAYDWRVLSRTNREGKPRPLELTGLDAVLRTIEADPQAVSFAWLNDVARNPRVRVVRVLWRE